MASPHITELRVRYAETDQMGVVYHANYLIWCEVARTDCIRALGTSYAEMERGGVALAVTDATLRFHASARYDDVIRVETTLSAVKSRTVTFDYRVVDSTSGARLASVRTVLVSVDRSGRVVTLPPMLRSQLCRGLA